MGVVLGSRAYGPIEGRSRFVFVAIEGVSGVGKSTLARELGRALDATVLHTIPDVLEPTQEFFRSAARPLPQLAFYLSAALHSSDLIRQALELRPVIGDRYFGSILANHSAVHEVPLDVVRGIVAPWSPYLHRPNLTLYLFGSEQAICDRLAQKSRLTPNDRQLANRRALIANVQDNYRRLCEDDPTGVEVQTDDVAPEEVAVRALAAISSRLSGGLALQPLA